MRWIPVLASILWITIGVVALAQPERPIHVVAPGDTLYAIAAAHGTSVDALRRLNGLAGDLLRVGDELVLPGVAAPTGYRPFLATADATWEQVAEAVERSVEALRSANPDIPVGSGPGGRLVMVPPGEGITYRARLGETLDGVAEAHGLAAGAVADANGLGESDRLLPGQPVLLPHGASRVPAVTTAAMVQDPRSLHREAQHVLLRQAAELLPGLAWPDAGFDLPVVGRLSSAFGWRNISVGGNTFHGGIDIAADAGTPVAVARSGVVRRTGWIGAYGNAVYVDHGDGTETRYAHLRAIYVQPGEVLLRGEPLGEVGSTGASTGPHLHFEVRIEGRAVDPLAYVAIR